MTARRGLVAICAASASVVAWAHAQGVTPQTSPQTFRSSTDVVLVDVSVRRGGAQVTGLTAADFELRDNDVKQDVETVEAAAVPIDLSIIVDVSGDPRRPWRNPPPVSKLSADIDARVRKLTRLLRPGDRVRLFAQDTYLQQVWPLQPAAGAPPVTLVDVDGQSSLFDTLATVLLQPVEPTRRHVIVGATKGLDTISLTTSANVRAIAEHSDAQLHMVMLEREADEEASLPPFQCAYMDLCRPTYRFWAPGQRRLFTPVAIGGAGAPLHLLHLDGQMIKAGAEATGGGLYQGEGLSEPSLFSTFERAFQNFRQSYVLRYTPKGVTREGWHQITVTVPREKSLRIQARPGYSVDVAQPPAAPVAPPPASNVVLRTMDDLTGAYERGGYPQVTGSLRQTADPARLIDDFEKAGNPWPLAPRREAALALEVAETGVFASRPPARDAGQKLLERFALLVRHPIEPDAFERAWLQAALTLLEGTIRPNTTGPFVERALQRYPNDPRLLLARAIVADQFLLVSGRAGGAARPAITDMIPIGGEDVVAKYTAAAAFPETAAEACIRLGWFLARSGKTDEALAMLTSPASLGTGDATLHYLRRLFSGHALVRLGRADDAIAAFRDALVAVPGAQSARVALMNALLTTGDRTEAAALAEDIQAATAAVIDPWWMYWQGSYRQYPKALAAVREMIR